MSELRKTYSGGLFYLTFTVVGWADVFTRNIYTDELIKNLQFCQEQKGLEIYAYVVMTNHIHLIASRKDELLFSDLIRDFKSFSAKRFFELILQNPQESRKEWMEMIFKYHGKGTKQNKEFSFWQKTSHPVALWSVEVTKQKEAYIHQNPVRAGFVSEPQDWRLSSASPNSPIKVLSLY
jgi:putative transposase